MFGNDAGKEPGVQTGRDAKPGQQILLNFTSYSCHKILLIIKQQVKRKKNIYPYIHTLHRTYWPLNSHSMENIKELFNPALISL